MVRFLRGGVPSYQSCFSRRWCFPPIIDEVRASNVLLCIESTAKNRQKKIEEKKIEEKKKKKKT